MSIKERRKTIKDKNQNVVSDLIESMVSKWSSYSDAYRIVVIWNWQTPPLWVKYGWIDNNGNLTALWEEKTKLGKLKRQEVRNFARKNNTSVNDIKYDWRAKKPTLR